MKKRITMLLVLVVSSCYAWSMQKEKPTFNCRTAITKSNNRLSFDKQIEEDLLNGIWVEESFNSRNGDQTLYFFQFNQFGAVDYMEISEEDGIPRYRKLSWRVELAYNDPLLVLRNTQSGKEQAFQIEQTCKGIDLVNLINGELKRLKFKPRLSSREYTSLKTSLSGEWGNSGISTGADNSLGMKYTFNRNGTYVKSLKGNRVNIVEEGKWEISKDGQFLILSCNNRPAKQQAELIRIKFLELDELVLEQKLSYDTAGINRAYADDYFNKR